MYDAVYISDGEKSMVALMKEGNAIHFINEAFKHGKAIATAGKDAEAREFATKFIDAIKEHRHWNCEEKMMVSA